MTAQSTSHVTDLSDIEHCEVAHGRRSGGAHRARLPATSRVAAAAVVAALSIAGAASVIGSASAAPSPRPDDLQLGSWVRSCAPGHPATRIDYFTDRGERGRADVGTGPGGTRSGIFLHRDGRGGEHVTVIVHCGPGSRSPRPVTFHVPGPGFNREVEHDL